MHHYLVGTSLLSLRKWLVQISDRCSIMLAAAPTSCPDFWSCQMLMQQLPQQLLTNMVHLDFKGLRLFLHQVMLPWLKSCPLEACNTWLASLLLCILHTNLAAVKRGWENLAQNRLQNGQGTSPELEEVQHRSSHSDSLQPVFSICIADSLTVPDKLLVNELARMRCELDMWYSSGGFWEEDCFSVSIDNFLCFKHKWHSLASFMGVY